MLFHLLEWLQVRGVLPINLFQYVTFRAAVALVTALLISLAFGNRLVTILRALKAGQPIRVTNQAGAPDLSQMHDGKKGTPTMGGLLIMMATAIPALMWCDLRNPVVWLLLGSALVFGGMGFLDDYLKVVKKNHDGLSARWKMIGTLAAGAAIGWYLLKYGEASYTWTEAGISQEAAAAIAAGRMAAETNGQPPVTGYGQLLFPFFKTWYPDLGLFFIALVMFILSASSNAVNLTDGLDGLCIGISAIVVLAFGVVAYLASSYYYSRHLMLPHVPRADEAVVVMGALLGACLGFLWFNAHPADMFMGDTGSFMLGGVIGTMAVVTKQEFLLGIIGGIYVLEAASVIIQVTVFKRTGRRVFQMAPIHHHFERLGVPETKIIVRFWIVTALLALAGIATLKLR